MLASLVPLTLLALALLGALGREDLWREDLAPAVQERVTRPVYAGIDYSVERIFSERTWPLIALASALTLWHVSRGVRVVMKALNRIHDVEERRSWPRLVAIDVALAVTLSLALAGAFLVVALLPRLATAPLSLALQIVAWLFAALLFSIAVGALVRYAPAERPEVRWASAGSLLVVVTWTLTTIVFGWWAGSVVSYTSAVGTLAAFLVLTAYVLASTTIFLVGVEVDEALRKRDRR